MALPDLSALSLWCVSVDTPNEDYELSLEDILQRDSKRKLKARQEAERCQERKQKRGKSPVRVPTKPAPAPPDDGSQSSSLLADSDWQVKKRLLSTPPTWRETNMFDFSFENPLDGYFKNLPFIKELLDTYPALVHQAGTSYCRYGYKYRKRTVFITSLPNFKPAQPCGIDVKCQWLRDKPGAKHPTQVLSCGPDEKNSLPPKLIDLLISSWHKRHADKNNVKKYLLIDVFSGWGSVDKRVEEGWPDVLVYSNDLVKRRHTDINMDMSAGSEWSPSSLLLLALTKNFPDDFDMEQNPVMWCNANKVAVLFHCSTPCDTYSQAGLHKHRLGATIKPNSDLARNHDAMNAELVAYFERTVLVAPLIQSPDGT